MSELKCLYCGKPLNESKDNMENQWHSKCCYNFFGTTVFPEINITKEQLEALATETVSKGYTVAGVQKKLSLHLSKEREHRLTLVGYPAGFILKPQTDEYKNLPEMENLVMKMAELTGIKTVPNALVKLNNQYAYITKRIDRLTTAKKVDLFAMEDFCQLSGRMTEDKYKSSYEQCIKVIKEFSSRSGLDISDFYYRLLFCFITGNSDMHLKNFSLIEKTPGSREYELSAAYDLLPVNIALPEDKEQFALTMKGKKSNLKKKDFIDFAKASGINEKVAEKMMQKILTFKEKYLALVKDSYLPEELQKKFAELIEERSLILCS